MVIEHANFEGVERLSLVSGGEIASTFGRPDLVKLGQCELVEEAMIACLIHQETIPQGQEIYRVSFYQVATKDSRENRRLYD